MTEKDHVIIFSNEFGVIELPNVPHKDRLYGGHVMITPADHGVKYHHVTDILDHHPALFYGYHLLCAVAEKAMLRAIPSLNGSLTGGRIGVINLFKAGNWQFHYFRKPVGDKDASSKKVHAHMYGRSPLEPCSTPEEKMAHWGWGEAPAFPEFLDTPFSPDRVGKKWKIPEGFNEEEISALRREAKAAAEQIKWPEKP